MNGWQSHKLDHVSPSQVNLMCNEPALWVLQYLLNTKTQMGASAWRGIAVEHGVVACLKEGLSQAEGLRRALDLFNAKTALTGDPKREKERENIEPMIALALGQLSDFGAPDFPEEHHQHKIEITCQGDGWSLPVIGYLDLVYLAHGLVVDLKTTLRMPSTMSREHQRQRCIYQLAMGNHRVKFLYVTPKKAEWRDDGDPAEVLAEVKTILNRYERFLKLSDDARVLADCVPVIPGSFYWNSPDAMAARQAAYGL